MVITYIKRDFLKQKISFLFSDIFKLKTLYLSNRNTMRNISYIFICFFIVLKGLAQDAQFSQIYGLPLYVNPAYTGNTESHRVALKYRNQWPGVNKAFSTMAASYDFNAEKLHSVIGLMYVREAMGTSSFINNNIRLLYAYNLQITREQNLRIGLNIDYTRKEIDLSKLIFNDQLYTKSGQTFEQLYNGNVNYFDAGAGALYSHTGGWLGVSVNHLNRPSTSTVDRSTRLPMYWHVNGGIKLIRNKEYNRNTKYTMIWASYRHQYKFNQLDIGAQFVLYSLTLGATYRGIPIQKKQFVDRNDAIAFTLGYAIPSMNMRFGYTYDLTVSRLSIKSSGSHEISLIFEVKTRENQHKKKARALCPLF